MPPEDAPPAAPPWTTTHQGTLLQRALLVSVVAVTVYGLLRALWTVIDTVLLLYLAAIVGMALRGGADWLVERTRLRAKGLALALILIACVGVPVGFAVVAAPVLGDQLERARQELPQLHDRLDAGLIQVEQRVGIRFPRARGGDGPADGMVAQLTNRPSGPILDWFSSFVGGVGAAAGGLFLVGVVGAYTAASPSTYADGFVRLIPPAHRPRARVILAEITHQHRRWVLGQVAAMVVVGALTTAGLAFLGVPMALLLGVLAGLLDFVPNFGPILAAAPAILVASGSGQVLPVLLLYAGIQTLEGYLLRPFIERQSVDTPPALLIAAQVLVASLVGFVGLLVAPALFVLGRILVERLYLEDGLGEAIDQSPR